MLKIANQTEIFQLHLYCYKKNIEQIMLDFNILISNLEDFTDLLLTTSSYLHL